MGFYPNEFSTPAILLLLLGCHVQVGQPQQDFLPPVLRLERNWNVPPTLPIGAEVTRVRAQNAGSNLLFGLETNDKPVPFRIDNATGIVYVNETLANKLGKSYSLWVTALDGKLEAKSEVWALVTNATGNQILPKRPKWPFLPINKSYQFIPPSLPPQYVPVQEITTTERAPTITTVASTLKTTEDTDNNTPIVTESSVADSNIEKKINESLPDDNEISNSNDVTLTVVPLVAIGCIIFIVIVVLIVLWKRNIFLRRKNTKKNDISKETPGNIVMQEHALNDWNRPRAPSNTYEAWDANHCQQNEIDSSLSEEKKDEWEVSRHRIRIFNIVGEGAFGQVWRATATDIDGQKGLITVAVKTMKENASEKEKQDLLLELEVMKKLNTHPNVVRLLGCCTEKEPTFVIMEFVALGKLQSFLRDSRAGRHYGNTHADSKTLTSRDLTHYAYQVARGMEFLSSNGIIHRDLAARNVLIDEERMCKVADFGFARDVAGTHVYERKSDGRLPIRWMAPESLYDDIFSVKSDIWSFGVLIWEIVTLGSTPYPGLSAADVMRRVREGHRLEKPEHCRRELYNIMYYCWEADPASRPDFKECVSLLEKLLMSEMDYIELERFPDHSYYNVQHLDGEKL